MAAWLPIALLFPALTGVVNIVDKLIVDRYSPSFYAYAAWIGGFELSMGLVSFVVVVGIQGVSLGSLLGGAAIGAVSAAGLLMYLAALRFGQVSRVVPIWFLYPLMVAPMAAVFLDERLPLVAIFAVVLAVAGAILVSWEGTGGKSQFGHPAVLLLALGAAVWWAVSFVLSKHFLEDGSFWQVFASYRLGFGPVILVGMGAPDVRRASVKMIRDGTFIRLMVLGEVIITVVLITRFAAVSLGPDISLIAAISAVQPVLVFLYSLVLAGVSPAIFGTWITRRTVGPQLAGIAAIAASVVIISLESI